MLVQGPQPARSVPPSVVARQEAIAAQATGVHGVPVPIEYLPEEHETWAEAHRLLLPLWDRYAAAPLKNCRRELDLPVDHIPQLTAVSKRLEGRTGFRYASVDGTVPGATFFGALRHRIFPSTQFIRWSGAPGYTPAPDILHEVGGHAHSLADSRLAELHRLAGQASEAVPSMLPAIASVFWYSLEFGVVLDRGQWRAYGTGLLSSPGELGWFQAHAEIRPINIAEMVSTPYDINRYQPVLFGASSLDQVYELVSKFYLDIMNRTGLLKE